MFVVLFNATSKPTWVPISWPNLPALFHGLPPLVRHRKRAELSHGLWTHRLAMVVSLYAFMRLERCVTTTQALEMMEKELGMPIAQVFSSISERPIAAASLGQVCPGTRCSSFIILNDLPHRFVDSLTDTIYSPMVLLGHLCGKSHHRRCVRIM